MKLFTECWLALLNTLNALTGPPTDGIQQSLGFLRSSGRGHVPHYPFPPEVNPLKFKPPSEIGSKDSSIECDYTAMGEGWRSCFTPEDRGCWLKGPGNKSFDINTIYEQKAPTGIVRRVFLYISRCLYHHND